MMTFPPRRCIARVTCHEDMVPKSDSVCGVCSVHDVIVAPVARGGPPKNRNPDPGRRAFPAPAQRPRPPPAADRQAHPRAPTAVARGRARGAEPEGRAASIRVL